MAITRRLLLFLLLSHIVLLSSFTVGFATSVTDTLSEGHNITDSETLVSSNGVFTMGFFSPGVSTYRYLGVWFSVSRDAVCWVANRERPLNSTSGVLVLDTVGRLLLIDGSSGETIWSSSNSSTTAPAVMKLLESGNLVVRDQSNGMIIWQSFDHLSNTLLAGMKMGWSNWTGVEWHLTSWRSADDPSPGSYRHVTEFNGLLEHALWHGDVMVYRTGPWNGLRFSGVTEVSTYANMLTFHLTMNPWEVTFGYAVKSGAPLTRIVATDDGFVKRLVWEASKATWVTYYQGPRDVCDHYAQCGPFGICNANTVSTSFCSCIKGFSPVSPSDWYARVTSGGCRRNNELDCGRTNGSTTDGFVVLQGIKLPDTHNASVDTSIDVTLEQCRMMCLANCSCEAYAPADIHDRNVGRGCIMWTDKLVDLRYVDGGQDIYLRMAQSELTTGGQKHGNVNKHAAVIAGVSIGVAIFFVCLAVLIFKVARRINIRSGSGHTPAVADVELAPGSSVATTVPLVDLPTIKSATRNFSIRNLIGQGACGAVYEGKLPRGNPLLRGLMHRTVAVKRLKSAHNPTMEDRAGAVLSERMLHEIRRSFEREVDLMSRLRQHENVARLLGICREGNERILVYEYAHRRSLDTYIFGTRKARAQLSWNMRLEIICGIAKGIAHLHEGSTNNVIHRDLKPSNVLLDEKWTAKVADFGTARMYIADETGTRTVIGTPGYMAPEYIRNDGDMTLKCDVYSFGITLLEVISGRRNCPNTRFLLCTARRLWDERMIMSLLDPAIAPPPSSDQELLSEVCRCIKIGLLCVHDTPDDRPTMPTVVEMLTSSSLEIPQPNMPVANIGTLATFREVGDTIATEIHEATHHAAREE
ncbi:hypothetical protein ACP70R_032059 [Stipagrostis hirtigluma subsp. patula]